MHWKPLLRATTNPQAAQMAVLKNILKRNQHTDFGRGHGFAAVHSYSDFCNAVPIQDYETLRPYIEQQDKTREHSLNSQHPQMYSQTSGTTGRPKYIPVLKSNIKQYRRSQHIVAYANYAAIPGVYSGKILGIVGPAVEGYLDSGIPYGSMSGLIYKSMPAPLRAKYVVPVEILDLKDYEEKYFRIAVHALMEQNISMIATANPSTLLKLHQVINQRIHEIVDAIDIITPDRGEEIRQLHSLNGTIKFSHLWSNLKSVVVWTGGSCRALIPALARLLPKTTHVVEMGYLSSEFRGSITVDAINNLAIPVIHENFYEFIECSQRNCDSPEYLTVEQLEPGKQYYLFATTQCGLYRYDINDIVEVTGYFNNTPTIRFVQKGKGVINLTGEKLYEDHLLEAIVMIKQELDIEFNFFIMIGCQQRLQYNLYVEHPPTDMSDIELFLCKQNIEFEAKRESGRLQPINIVFVREGTGEAFKRHQLSKGQKEAQYKVVHVQYQHECSFNFEDYLHRYDDGNTRPYNREP
ncbi:MAG: hypothetical protein DHS20C01_30850 [marine bacterium B5-7]|nr:MAG: hypothetical protein DHS20C01_30850 [marine bacterium B5-7]